MRFAPKYPRTRRAAVAALLAGFAAPALGAAQSVAEAEAPKPTTILKESLKEVRALHEMRDGKVLIVDAGAKKVVLADFVSGKVEDRWSEGTDESDYRSLEQLWSWQGDSVASFDQTRAQFVVFGPDGRVARKWRFGAPSDAPPPPAGGVQLGAGPAAGRGGAPRIPMIRTLIGTDIAIAAGPSSRPPGPVPPGAPPARLPYPLLRLSLRRPRPDTIAQLMPAQLPRAPLTNSVGTFTVFVSSAPLQAVDVWAAYGDGTVAVVRAASYRIDWYAPDGTHTQTDSIPFTAVPVSSNDRKRVIEDYKKVGEAALAALPTRTSILAMAYEEPTVWPPMHPPFRGDVKPMVDPKDRLWLATRCGSDEAASCYDVIARDGTRVVRYRFPARTLVVGFGRDVMYTVNAAKSDKHILQRQPLP